MKDRWIRCALAVPFVLAASLAQAADNAAAQKATVQDLRDTGVALFSWLTDQFGAAAAAAPAAEAEAHNPESIGISEYSPISLEDLRALLVPKYIAEVPETDGWGHPYQYFLNRDTLTAKRVMLIRSAGADGQFDTDSYKIGFFGLADVDRDLVWADGYFIRWPAASK